MTEDTEHNALVGGVTAPLQWTTPRLPRIWIAVCLVTLALVCTTIGYSYHSSKAPSDPQDFDAAAKTSPLVGKGKNECEGDKNYPKTHLKTAVEMTFAALFNDNKGQKKFEASDVILVDGAIYAVCDDSWSILKFDTSLPLFSESNIQIGDPNRISTEDSEFEALFHNNGTFYAVRESIKLHDQATNKKTYHAIVLELDLGADDYSIIQECPTEFSFEGASKGFEGAVGFEGDGGDLYMIGLCEGNHCSESRKHDAGNGYVVLTRKAENENGDGCYWKTIRSIKIPSSANFLDYSALDITSEGRVAISSQESSKVWIGQAEGIKNGIIDPDEFSFKEKHEHVYSFPKSNDCNTVYCNIEGIHFMNDEMLIGVSDKMKTGKQDYRCFNKDQSIHAFVLP